jgi:hypothetical protein
MDDRGQDPWGLPLCTAVRADAVTGASGTIILAHSLAGPIGVIQCITSSPQSGDPQFGYKSANAYGAYGSQDEEFSDSVFLNANPNIMIGMGFFDNVNPSVWYHIGIGNNKCAGSPSVCFSSCSTPPYIWGEYAYNNVYYEMPFLCGSYNSWYGMAIVVDNLGFWDYFVNGVFQTGVYNSYGGTTIGSNGNYDFIETAGTPPGQRSPPHFTTIFSPALQYAKNKLNYNNLNLGTITFANPTTLTQHVDHWSYSYWSENDPQSSGIYSITYTWS